MKPIKRTAELAPLSREHHDGLLLCWKIRQGLKKEITTDRINAYLLYFFDNHLKQHFREEEDYLLPYLDSSDPVKFEILSQHDELVGTAIMLRNRVNEPLLNQFADLLEKHIRYEERTSFPYLELHLNTSDLSSIGLLLNKPDTPVLSKYADEFWA